jgi:hypothetical protein
MPLTNDQITYITHRTNERGAAHTPNTYIFMSTTTFASSQNEPDGFLNIVIKSSLGEIQGGRDRGARDYLTDQEKFAKTVEEALTVAERHLA